MSGTVRSLSCFHPNIVALDQSDSIDTAAAQFERYGFDALPVVGASGKLMGVLLARDVITVGEW